MNLKEHAIKGVFEISLSPRIDTRGFFMRTYDHGIFRNFGIHRDWVQENHSRSEQKGIIRGLHFQFHPFCETKLIRCIRGRVFDVFVDLRMGSATFGSWGSVILDDNDHKQIYIPRGFAHGFCTLSEISEIVYKVDNSYSPENEGGILWNDQDLAINWPVKDPILSEKDMQNITMREFIKRFNCLKV